MNKIPIKMPLLSDTMQTGRLARWLKQPGDAVKTGDVLAEVESDKAIMDVEAFADGYLVGPLSSVDTDIPVKTTIAWIADQPAPSEEMPAEIVQPEKSATTATATPTVSDHSTHDKPTPIPTAPTPAPPTAPMNDLSSPDKADTSSPVVTAALAARRAGDTGASPFARGLAAELNIDLTQLAPGPDGRIGAIKVMAAALGAPVPHLELGPPYTIKRPSAIKAAMAENMTQSVHTPTFHITIAVDFSPLQAAARTEHESLSLLLARACSLSVHKHPEFNACWTPDGLAQRERIDIAIAVDTPDGLITPVLRDAMRPLNELTEDWRELKGKLARRHLTPADYTGATFYLSNLGTFPCIEQFDAIVPSGAAAILAVAARAPDGLTRLTLSCDHRVVAGADAARFLATLSEHLSAIDSLQ